MCGRFVGFRNMEQLRQYFPIQHTACEAVSNFNVAPGQQVLVISDQEGINVLDKYHWGLVPSWAKDLSIGHRMINARSETVAQKPSFRNAFKRHRCLIPADGFYEWTGPKGRKQPVYITLPEERPFAFAGLWEIWSDRQNENVVHRSCTIITREASASIRDIHHRMPAIVHPRAYDAWLDAKNQAPDRALGILRDDVITELRTRPVSPKVNAASHNDPSNIRPVQTRFDF